MNAQLDRMAEEGEGWLRSLGYRAEARTVGKLLGEETPDFRTRLPHKTAATRAGLGWIGKCALLVTEQYGSGIRLSTILTDAPLEVGVPVEASRCGGCTACQSVCPPPGDHRQQLGGWGRPERACADCRLPRGGEGYRRRKARQTDHPLRPLHRRLPLHPAGTRPCRQTGRIAAVPFAMRAGIRRTMPEDQDQKIKGEPGATFNESGRRKREDDTGYDCRDRDAAGEGGVGGDPAVGAAGEDDRGAGIPADVRAFARDAARLCRAVWAGLRRRGGH